MQRRCERVVGGGDEADYFHSRCQMKCLASFHSWSIFFEWISISENDPPAPFPSSTNNFSSSHYSRVAKGAKHFPKPCSNKNNSLALVEWERRKKFSSRRVWQSRLLRQLMPARSSGWSLVNKIVLKRDFALGINSNQRKSAQLVGAGMNSWIHSSTIESWTTKPCPLSASSIEFPVKSLRFSAFSKQKLFGLLLAHLLASGKLRVQDIINQALHPPSFWKPKWQHEKRFMSTCWLNLNLIRW